jgi:hypothetical protein
MNLEATPMTYNRFISTAVLLMLLGATIPAFAQKDEEKKGGGGEKAPQAEHQTKPQHAEKAAPQQHAQKAEPQRAEKAVPQQHAQKSEPQRTEKAQPQRAQATRQSEPSRGKQTQTYASNRGNENNGNHGDYGRISNANYNSHFGHDHHFRVGRPEMIGGYNRFQYGGYSFGYNEAWPVGWGYNDNCYVVYEDGAYYMYDLVHPGIHISLSIF